jgi:hypothetical protein
MHILLVLLLAQAAPDRPAGDTRKHLQVLQAVPESQLFLVMNAVSQSLDVHCDYCHVRVDDKWQWERDDKPKKDAARKMMKMVVDLNRANFSGSTKVTCFTCHRGSLKPAALLPLPPSDRSNPPAAAALPSARAVLDAYYSAVGRDIASTFRTTVMRATDERSEGRISTVEYTLKGPDKIHVTRTAAGQEPISQAIDGTSGWSLVAGEQHTLTAGQVDQVRRSMAVFEPIKVTAPAEALSVAGVDVVSGRPAYVLVTDPAAAQSTRYYFDAQNGLLLRQLSSTVMGIVYLQEQIDFEDYRDTDGVKLPFTIRISDVAPYDNSVRRFTQIRHNVVVDDAIFHPRLP